MMDKNGILHLNRPKQDNLPFKSPKKISNCKNSVQSDGLIFTIPTL